MTKVKTQKIYDSFLEKYSEDTISDMMEKMSSNGRKYTISVFKVISYENNMAHLEVYNVDTDDEKDAFYAEYDKKLDCIVHACIDNNIVSTVDEKNKTWLAFVDTTDGQDRESWSPFYIDIFSADTEAEAKRIGEKFLKEWQKKEGVTYGEVFVRITD